ncbi:MAG: exodeoxyribonuclease III [Betaproteobacteria bacterium]|nr:MAG: exodeoxyribonuclease III [Betaproteobacteria bacterium]
MKIATWNVNGIRAREAQLCEWIERDRPDVVCLQEIKARPDQVPDRCKLSDYHVFWHGGGGYSGVSLHLKRELLEVPDFSHPHFDIETRIVQVALGNLVLASVYVPNGGKDYAAKIRFMTDLVAWAKLLHDQGRELVLCGDINIARADIDVHPRERKADVIGQLKEERDLFEALLGENLVDVTRAKDPDNERLFTWWPPWRNMRQRNIGWRIDYILASRAIADGATRCTVLTDVGTSDHAPILMDIAWQAAA